MKKKQSDRLIDLVNVRLRKTKLVVVREDGAHHLIRDESIGFWSLAKIFDLKAFAKGLGVEVQKPEPSTSSLKFWSI